MTRVSRMVRIGVSVLVLAAAAFLIWPLQASAGDYSFSFYLSEQDVVIERSSSAPRIIVKNKGFHLLADDGMPTLPVRTVNILLPQGEVVRDFNFGSSGFSVVAKNFNPSMAPSPVSEDGIKGLGQSLFPGSDPGSAFPPALGRYLGTGYYRGFAVASFLIAPVQYDKGAVKLRGEITLSIKTGFPDAAVDIVSRERYREGFGEKTARELASLVVNPSMINTYVFDEVRVPRPKGGFNPSSAPSLEGSPVDCIIITADSLKSAYQQLADFKTAKGVPSVVKTIEWIQANYRNGVDIQETIRFFIRDAYQKWGISWVLLGGDTDIIPARYAFNRFYENGTLVPTDMYFACIDGSWNDTHDAYWGEGFYYVLLDNPDLYADVYLGRLPTSNVGDVKNMVNKIISYETPVNRDYTDEAELLAEVLFPVDWKEGQPMTLNGADLAEYLYSISMQGGPLDVTRSYETYSLFTGAVPESRQATIDSMNVGKNIIQHIGHGFRFNMSVADASVMNSDADALTNIDRYFMLYMLNCTAGAYDYYCLAEHYLRNTAGGAVAIIASNRSAFPNASSYYMNDFYDLLLNQDVSHIGEAFAKSRLNRTPIAEAGDNVDLWTHYIYTLLADPEMPLWTAQVDTLNVFHIANVGLGENTILVNVTAGGLPVDTALVCLYKGQDDYQYAPTNTLGNATFNFTCEQPGSISVVVTGLNHARHQSYITVDPSGSGYVSFSSLAADDDSTGGSYGNGDAVINAGETVDLSLFAANSGGAAADGVWCVLRSSDPQVTINDSIAYFGSLTAGETKQAYDPVNASFSGTITDETSIPFTLEFHDTLGSIWNDSFNKVVHVPVLELMLLSIDDSAPLGNGNGVVEPNEEFLLYCEMKNYGTGTATGLSAQLQDLSFNFVFIDSTDIYADISPLGSSNNTAGFHIKEAIVTIENDMELTITDLFGNVYLDTIELRIPDPPSNLMFDASKGADRIEVSWLKSITADVKKYNVYHSLTSGGPYDLISVDPVDHAVFMDVDLPSSTRYYYVVTAVDKSGNESAFSTEYYASTNPPQLGGWPIEMLDYTASSPAVGDIDGDGDKEVITGNKYVYAWHHNGVEIRDGDLDPQTWGILCTTGADFVAPVALAKIDSVMGLDIVAVSYTSLGVYCFDYQGNTLAGWPQMTETNVRATPVIADLDGDRDPEIIVVDQAGVLYAWNSDGTEYMDGDFNPATPGVFYRTPTAPTWHYQAPAVCDLDKDNMDEIILGTTVDTIYAFNGDGTQMPGWPVAADNDIAGSVVAGDIDLDGDIEIVAMTKSPGVMVLNPDGTAQAGWPKWMPSYTGFNPSPALADYYRRWVSGDNCGRFEQ